MIGIETGVKKPREIQESQSRWWRFVDVDYFTTINIQHNHSISDVGGDWFKRVLVALGQTLQGHASCLKRPQLAASREVLVSLN